MKNYFNIFEFLTPKPNTNFVLSSNNVEETIELFNEKKFSIIPIIDIEGNFVSTISEGDLLRYVTNKDNDIYANILDVPTYRSYRTLDISASFEEVCVLSLDQNFIPILDDRGKYIGIIPRKAVIKYLFSHMEEK